MTKEEFLKVVFSNIDVTYIKAFGKNEILKYTFFIYEGITIEL